MSDLKETLADVIALVPRYSWEIMDEEQRDELMAKIVLPRYMKTTADHIQLGPTAWAEMIGASVRAIESRVQRLKASQKTRSGEHAGRSETASRAGRAARQVLREASPEEIAEQYLADPQVREKVHQAQDIAYKKQNRESKERFREHVGAKAADALDEEQNLRDAEAELFKARRAVIEMLRILNASDSSSIRDSWREEFLLTIDDVAAKLDLGRELLSGTLVEELEQLLGEGA